MWPSRRDCLAAAVKLPSRAPIELRLSTIEVRFPRAAALPLSCFRRAAAIKIQLPRAAADLICKRSTPAVQWNPTAFEEKRTNATFQGNLHFAISTVNPPISTHSRRTRRARLSTCSKFFGGPFSSINCQPHTARTI